MSVEGEAGNKDKGQLLGIFPGEVWLEILKNVKNTKDFQRISDASPYLGTLLRPLATQALFPEVLKIILQHQPPLFGSLVDLVPLRQVCHAWKSGVEQALEDPEYPFLFEREQFEKRFLMKNQPASLYKYIARIRNLNEFGAVEDFTKFQHHFNATRTAATSNPLFCREVAFYLPPSRWNFTPYFEACLEFLQTYGIHILNCLIVQDFADLEQHREFYSVGLKQLLALMSNVRRVHFADEVLRLPQVQSQQLLQSVEDSMAVTPVPELKHLKMICIEGFQEVPLPFLRALLQKNPQVSIVSDTSDTPTENHVPLYLSQMPNLTALELKLNNRPEFDAFRRTPVSCPLVKLHLNIKWGKEELRAPFAMRLGPLFRVLESRFSATLTELSLKFHCRVDSDEEGLQLQLPELKKFSITFREEIIPLEFVLSLKDTLEQLVVGVRYPGFWNGNRLLWDSFSDLEAEQNDRSIKLYQFWMDPQKSNAWVLFPKLKLLTTAERRDMYSCSREEWIAKQPK